MSGNVTTKELLEGKATRTWTVGHLVRHTISGSIVFLLGLGADLVVSHYYGRWTLHRVVWQDAVRTNTSFTMRPLPTNSTHHIALGFTEDGHVTWKELP